MFQTTREVDLHKESPERKVRPIETFVEATIIIKQTVSTRSTRFRRDFRRFEALFAFWPREKWGEQSQVPQFSRGQKAKRGIENACYAG